MHEPYQINTSSSPKAEQSEKKIKSKEVLKRQENGGWCLNVEAEVFFKLPEANHDEPSVLKTE